MVHQRNALLFISFSSLNFVTVKYAKHFTKCSISSNIGDIINLNFYEWIFDVKPLWCNGDTNLEPDSLSLGGWLGSHAIHFLVRFPLTAVRWGVRILVIGSSWVGHADPSGNPDYLKWLIERPWPAISCCFTFVESAARRTTICPAASATAYGNFYSQTMALLLPLKAVLRKSL